jgi:ABC-type lipoprotein release transport system permease subunit
MVISFNYIARNLAVRKFTTLLTAGGMALVVFVFATVLMMADGLRETLGGTGSWSNVMVIRKSAQTEVQSSIERHQAAIISTLPEIATDASGLALASAEPVVLIALGKRGSGKLGNVVVRGVSRSGLELRPQVRITEGRMFRPGSAEIVVGHSIAKGFDGAQIGDTLRFGQQNWTVVGLFDAGHSGFDSEVWGDAEQMMQVFRRPAFSSMLFRLRDPSTFERIQKELESDQRLNVEVKRETRFYADQSEQMATFISVLGQAISLIFSLGAVIGAMITMYASVANRTGEIGTLRALGFTRQSVMVAFLLEAVLLGVVGGGVGLLAASLMQYVQITTTNFQTFAELAFTMRLNLHIVLEVMLFAIFMGLVGGFLPAARAARLEIVEALRAA